MTTETLDPPTDETFTGGEGTYTPPSIPLNFERASWPEPARKATSKVNPALVESLRATLNTSDALAFPLEGLDDKQATRLAARLNSIGRRGAVDFTVRTRRAGDRLYARAIPKQPRRQKAKG